MKIKKNTIYLVFILAVLVIGGYLVMSKGTNSGGFVSDTGKGETQKVVLSFKNYNYYPQEVRVKVNRPVEISLDSSVTGCFRDFTMREFGVRKYLATPQDSVVFTPTKTGRFTFACSMSMGTGILVVE